LSVTLSKSDRFYCSFHCWFLIWMIRVTVWTSLPNSPILNIATLPCESRNTKNWGFRAQRFYSNRLPVFVFLHHPTDLDKPDKPVTSVFFLILQHKKSYKPSKNGPICTSAYLLCAQRFYRSLIFDRTSVHTLIAPCIAARSVTKLYRKSNLTACTKFLSIHFCQNCHSFFKLATLKIHSWKELSKTILTV